MANFKEYFIKDVIISGTPHNPQVVKYEDLTDFEGNNLPSRFSPAPMVNPLPGTDMDCSFYCTEDPGQTSFKVSRGTLFRADITQFLSNIIISGIPYSAPIGYTLPDLLNMMSFYLGDIRLSKKEYPKLEDIKESKFSPQFKTELLNFGQEDFMSRLEDFNVLNELFTEETGLSLTDGVYNLLSLDDSIYEYDRGIILLKAINGTYKYYARKRSINQFRYHLNKDNEYKDYSKDTPIYYVKGYSVYVEPHDSSTTMDLTYIRNPNVIVFDKDGIDHIHCEFNKRKTRIIMGLSLKDFVDFTPQARRLYENSLIEIDKLNDKDATDSIKDADVDGDINYFGGEAGNIYNIRQGL